MKKLFSLAATSLLVALPLMGAVASPKEVQAYDPTGVTTCGEGLVSVKVHFHSWDSVNYSQLGAWTWNTGTNGSSAPIYVAEVDEFGAVFNFCVHPETAGAYMGFIPVSDPAIAPPAGWNWGTKLTDGGADIMIPLDDVKASGLGKDVYVFEGAGNGANDAEKAIGVYSIDPTKRNVLLMYYDPSGAYEDNLGVHPWGPYSDVTLIDGADEDVLRDVVPMSGVEWAKPAKIFEDGGLSPSGVKLKTALLTGTGADGLGGLIYAGDDATKKHDATANSFTDPFGGFSTMAAGEVAIVAVANEKIFGLLPDSVTPDSATYAGDLAAFAEEAFKFELSAFEAGEGTHAVNPETVIVKTNIAVPTPADAAAAIALFELKDASDAVVEIESVNYSASGLSTNAFVLNLGSSLDNTKEYTLTYKGFPREAELVVDLDDAAPVIEFTDEAVIELELGAAWDSALIPDYSATDDRDGDITGKVYIPAGEGSFHTGVVGEYPITLKVVDAWGNEGTATFTIKVVEPEVAAGCAGTAAAGANNGLGYLLAFVLAGFVMKKALVK